ncbi:Bifunctional polymyxin resistance protein ArnA [Pseudidiomarina piscicola]|uniref:Bifunctional polymyxin resistance protein ArnA n=1 Tax=Pseudidiomarina piscicola TaxID=2614830 RepID=A0A6S6WV31_9GAMM|nr:formyltransferase family protein [Pseudidiomarina piscicola]CAB0151224.1 Bifunctional polymyxin resistance protein ArnA [Pseudidiomarina piscicola]VZT40730.1 Bifunctional polymyxin resistance protein ArnA [Pseudomonas aeruginosa]
MIKIGFVTCVQLGLSCMEALHEAGGQLSFAMTLEDDQAVNKSGRVYLDDFCECHSVPLLKSRHVNNCDVIEAIKSHELDWLFIIGWSQIASEDLLRSPKRGVLGMHPTLLPQGRGRAAIPWAILKGLDKTGVTLFKLDTGVDTGPIVDQVVIPLSSSTNAQELYQSVNKAHIALMRKVVPVLMADKLNLQEQDRSLATEWPGRRPEDGQIDLNGSVYDAEKLVRAVTRPYPGAFYLNEGKKIVVWKAQTTESPSVNALEFKDGWLELIEFEVSRSF